MGQFEKLMVSLGVATAGLDDDQQRGAMIELLRTVEGERMAGYLMHLRARLTNVLQVSGREGAPQ